MKPHECPFCGVEPIVRPTDVLYEGGKWARVQCDNDECPVQPGCNDGIDEFKRDRMELAAIKAAAIQRWNRAIETHAR